MTNPSERVENDLIGLPQSHAISPALRPWVTESMSGTILVELGQLAVTDETICDTVYLPLSCERGYSGNERLSLVLIIVVNGKSHRDSAIQMGHDTSRKSKACSNQFEPTTWFETVQRLWVIPEITPSINFCRPGIRSRFSLRVKLSYLVIALAMVRPNAFRSHMSV
jgi:hypothetical protein